MFSVIIIYVIISTIWRGTHNREGLQFMFSVSLQITRPAQERLVTPPSTSLLFSNSGAGTFTSHKNQISEISVRRDLLYGFSSLSEKTRKSNRLQMSLQRQHFLLSYFKTLIVGSAGVQTHDLPLSRPALSQPAEITRRRYTLYKVSVTLKYECSLLSHLVFDVTG